MKMKLLIGIVCCIVMGVVSTTAVAIQQNPRPKHVMREDSVAVNALVMYPDTIRLHIFEACEYPAAIVSVASLQKNSSGDFDSLISGYSRDEQEDLWNLSRYPALISALAQGGRKSADQINTMLTEFPADVHEIAVKYGTQYYDLIQKMDTILSQADDQFEQIISDYPPVTQDAFRDIIQYPEIISLLNDHLDLAVRVGDRFRRNPERVIHKADSLNLAETRKEAEDADAWKQRIEQNPDEAADLQQAASDYATENGYTQEDLNTSPNPEDVSNYTCSPYSYWLGYPTWYPYSYWYPYPFWFDCGFYHDRFGRIVIIGSPSSYFTNWYFYYPEHWHRYPNLCNAYIDHYYGPRRVTGRNAVLVHTWVRDNRNYLPKDFIGNSSRRTEVIREVGQLNMDARKQEGGKPVAPAVRDQYFRNNISRYPSLNADQKTRLDTGDRQRDVPVAIPQPVKQPPVRIARPMQPPARIVQPVRPPALNPRRAPTPPAYRFKEINRAQEYQRNVWEQSQPAVRPQPQPARRPEPQQPVRQEPPNRQPPEKKR
jgi:hypothetical protein